MKLRDEDEEGTGTFFGVYSPSVLFFNPVILEGKEKGGEQCKSRDLKEDFRKLQIIPILPSAFRFCLTNPGICDNSLSVFISLTLCSRKAAYLQFCGCVPSLPTSRLCQGHPFHQHPLPCPPVSQSEPSEKTRLVALPLLRGLLGISQPEKLLFFFFFFLSLLS